MKTEKNGVKAIHKISIRFNSKTVTSLTKIAKVTAKPKERRSVKAAINCLVLRDRANKRILSLMDTIIL